MRMSFPSKRTSRPRRGAPPILFLLLSLGLGVTSIEGGGGALGTFSVTGRLGTARESHAATLLPRGKVLVVGGLRADGHYPPLASAELYDPATASWSITASLGTARGGHTATLLPSGKVLVAGGVSTSALATAELYDPATESWSTTGSLGTARVAHTATLLPSGKVLVAAGITGVPNVALA